MIEASKYLDSINSATINTFTQIANTKNRIAVVYKFDTPLFTEEFEIKTNKKFSLFELGSINSLNVMFAYIFVFPFKSFILKEKYFTIRRPSSKNLINYSGVDLIYQSKYINVYNSEDGDCLISANGLNRVILTEIVRKSKKNK